MYRYKKHLYTRKTLHTLCMINEILKIYTTYVILICTSAEPSCPMYNLMLLCSGGKAYHTSVECYTSLDKSFAIELSY